MDLTQLRSFVTVARLGHLTRAAEAVHLSQPALSGHIKALEEELGVQLFDRTPSGMAITPSGKRLLVDAEAIVQRVQQMQHTARSLSRELTGKLRIGTVLHAGFLRVGELAMRSFARHPEVELDLHHVLSHDALTEVRNGTLDASFYFGTLPDDLDGIPLRKITYRVLVPSSLAPQLRRADLATLAQFPWIVTPEHSSHRLLVQKLFADDAFPARTVEADNEAVIVNLVESGVGVSLVREELANESVEAGRSMVWADAAITTDLWMVHLPDRRNDPLIEALLDVLAEVWDAATPQKAAA